MRFLCVVVLVSICSCQNSDDGVESVVVTYLTSKEFMISDYSSNGSDETQEFSGYIFNFHRNKTVAVEGNGHIITGTWDAYYVTSPEIIDSYNVLELNFINSDLFQNINKEWTVTLSSPNEIALRYDFKYFLRLESSN